MNKGRRYVGSIVVGCAGWSIGKLSADAFPAAGTHLQRYSAVLDCVEINSSFYRPHRPATYARWADSVPENFRFSVKMPKTVTHEARLVGTKLSASRFLSEASALGNKLGCLLIQLPPSLAFDTKSVRVFLRWLRTQTDVAIALEPRHATWFDEAADNALLEYAIARVAADPALVPAAAAPGGDTACSYFRLHGAPRMYYSSYAPAALTRIADSLISHAQVSKTVWCIFDNTAAGAATQNALSVQRRVLRAAK